MKQFVVIAILAASLSILATSSVDAGSPSRGRRWTNRNHAKHYVRPHGGTHDGYPDHYSRYKAYEYWYPKYYGSFHSRHILMYGYPSGDLGLRGFAW